MKKILSFGFLLFFLFMAEGFKLIAEEKSAWEGTESGDYLIYQDLSWNRHGPAFYITTIIR